MKNFANAKFLILYIFNFCKNNPGVVLKKDEMIVSGRCTFYKN